MKCNNNQYIGKRTCTGIMMQKCNVRQSSKPFIHVSEQYSCTLHYITLKECHTKNVTKKCHKKDEMSQIVNLTQVKTAQSPQSLSLVEFTSLTLRLQ